MRARRYANWGAASNNMIEGNNNLLSINLAALSSKHPTQVPAAYSRKGSLDVGHLGAD
jgi:hypothetical protein